MPFNSSRAQQRFLESKTSPLSSGQKHGNGKPLHDFSSLP